MAEILDDAYSTMCRRCFMATDWEKADEPKITSSEICEVVLLILPELHKLPRSGKLINIKAGYLGLNRFGLL